MERFLTLEETAQRTGCPVKSIRNLIFRGRFPYSKIGGLVRVSEEELERFLKLSRKTTVEEAVGREAA